jgi:hypothetical protein
VSPRGPNRYRPSPTENPADHRPLSARPAPSPARCYRPSRPHTKVVACPPTRPLPTPPYLTANPAPPTMPAASGTRKPKKQPLLPRPSSHVRPRVVPYPFFAHPTRSIPGNGKHPTLGRRRAGPAYPTPPLSTRPTPPPPRPATCPPLTLPAPPLIPRPPAFSPLLTLSLPPPLSRSPLPPSTDHGYPNYPPSIPGPTHLANPKLAFPSF